MINTKDILHVKRTIKSMKDLLDIFNEYEEEYPNGFITSFDPSIVEQLRKAIPIEIDILENIIDTYQKEIDK